MQLRMKKAGWYFILIVIALNLVMVVYAKRKKSSIPFVEPVTCTSKR